MSLILIDGSALIYRSYYAFAKHPLTAPSGEQTSVVFGFFNSALSLIERYRPGYLAVAFDLPVKTFRHEMYPKYKAHRKPMPEELAEQIPRLRELLGAWGIAILERERFEADDVMATVAQRSASVCDQAWFYTGDKDFMQLLDSRTGMLKPGRRGDDITEFTVQSVMDRYALPPEALIDVFALAGDKSDNIPGAPGVGEKTAQKLIKQFGSLEELYDHLDDNLLTPRLRRVLAENQEQVFLSRRLFTIDREVSIAVDWAGMKSRLPRSQAVMELLRQLGLRRPLDTIARLSRDISATVEAVEEPDAASKNTVAVPGTTTATEVAGTTDTEEDALAGRGYLILGTEDALAAYLADLPAGIALAVDTETDSLRRDTATLVGISLAVPGYPPAYVPVRHRRQEERGGGAVQTAPTADEGTLFAAEAVLSELDWVRRRLKPLLADESRLKVGQNLKYDEWILTRHGMPLGGPRFDTMVAAYVLDPGRQRYNLDDLVAEYLGEQVMSYNQLFEAGDKRRDILTVPLAKLAFYAAEDADVTLRLHESLQKALAQTGLERLFTEIEMPLSSLLFTMEHNGIKIDTTFLRELRDRFATELDRLEKEIHAAAGEPFNIQSPKQLSRILFEKIKLKPVKKTATGWSTDVSVLEVLAEAHPLPSLVLEFRQLAKLQSTYVDSLPQLVNPETGLIHTSYNQAVAATGRLSSSDPNLQNIPVRSETGRQIRRAFVPRAAENVFLSADYSQIELRLLAHLSGDKRLTEAFQEGGDVHRRTAALIAGVSEEEVTSQMRSRAKAINFGVIYGMGAVALGKQIDVSTKEAKIFIETYFATYPGVRMFIEAMKEKARKDGYVETLLGRRRPLPDILSQNNRIRSFQERIAVNTPIQGTAADLIKLAMIHIDHDLHCGNLACMLLLQVHDELVLELPHAELDEVRELVRARMEGVLALNVPLVVDMHVGRNWAEAHG